MMGLLEPALQVPFIIRTPKSLAFADKKLAPVYQHPVSLLDLFPTMVSLAGLPSPPASFRLNGINLVPHLADGSPAHTSGVFSWITRCHNCSLSYSRAEPEQCALDAAADAAYFVPCCMTPSRDFDYVGVSIRSNDGFRFTTWCVWDGSSLSISDWDKCAGHGLWDLRTNTTSFRPEANQENVAKWYPDVVERLFSAIRRRFERQHASRIVP